MLVVQAASPPLATRWPPDGIADGPTVVEMRIAVDCPAKRAHSFRLRTS